MPLTVSMAICSKTFGASVDMIGSKQPACWVKWNQWHYTTLVSTRLKYVPIPPLAQHLETLTGADAALV